ncbi:family 16 glycosylhydrolase [Qipengyuania qiaonensis]|uniref:Family 16 glycosylhydrolase n=1 Tax=Qipengyuania qiaonensis TaxID=2867240 RepID=A0ABS7J9P4_9SPHN|nr:family 16 glycosylhydrolase [Qipengyuania qiaonensis]MBX7483663.1 family 16 glycosylhydrolase [Qipengyuania qiaonensis]
MTKTLTIVALGAATAACGKASEAHDEARFFTMEADSNASGAGAQQSLSAEASKTLLPLDLSDMKKWDFAKTWHASEWANQFGALPWKYDHVLPQPDGNIVLILDSKGAPQLQAVDGTPASADGIWEVDVTLPQLRSGVIVAPLWLYNQKTRDEIDFEFIGTKGLQVTVHTYPNRQHSENAVQLFWGQNMSGRRMRLGIEVDQDGGTITMLVDGKVVHRFAKADLTSFPTSDMRPLIEMWAIKPSYANLVSWAGPWDGFGDEENMTMVVHGYTYRPRS